MILKCSVKAGLCAEVRAETGKTWDPETWNGGIWAGASVSFTLEPLEISELGEVAHFSGGRARSREDSAEFFPLYSNR